MGMGLTNADIKYVQSLRIKKFRQKYHQFVVEGDKSVKELLHSDWEISRLYHSGEFTPPASFKSAVRVSPKEMERLSHHKTPQQTLAVVNIPEWESSYPQEGIHLFLDGVRDPGNLGTILRIADWYGLKEVWCSEDTVDLYNPKSIDASMGSFLRVKLHVANAHDLLSGTVLPSFASVMDGENIHKAKLTKDALIFIGNEGQGIQPDLIRHCGQKIGIPKYGKAESLNAGIATAILLDNFFRRA